jgi:hypothetical protein
MVDTDPREKRASDEEYRKVFDPEERYAGEPSADTIASAQVDGSR